MMGSSMSLTEARKARPLYDRRLAVAPPLAPNLDVFSAAEHLRRPRLPQIAQQDESGPAAPSPIIPPHSVAGRALLAVIAIMSFLAALTLGAVVLVRTTATEWQGQVSRELTIQVRPAAGRDLETDVARAAEIARATPGISQVNPYSKEESARLLEPWLGTGLSLDQLPVPRLIVVRVAPGAAPELDHLRAQLRQDVPTASLDDHRGFVERMRSITRMAVLFGGGILALVLVATVLLVAFATRGAMATNRAIVEVLHFVGAKNRYIAGQFQRHFLLVGLKGAIIGGGAAIALFLFVPLLGRLPETDSAPAGGAFPFGPTLEPSGYAGILGLLVLVAAVTALTSRWTVRQTLNALD